MNITSFGIRTHVFPNFMQRLVTAIGGFLYSFRGDHFFWLF